MKATVDKDVCIGCGLCVSICPTVFTMEGETATVIVEEVTAADEEACRQAADDCPVGAIEIRG